MDWTTPGDLHKRFKIFKQKCELIFDGPLDETSEDKKTRLLLLWAGDKGLEIYNTATWAQEEDSLKLGHVFEKFEQYTKPQSKPHFGKVSTTMPEAKQHPTGRV